ncbi:MAG: YdcF family protein [Cyclobacteriaceae bacterium]
MFFFLSKTLNYLMMPLVIIIIPFIATAFVKNSKWKKRCFITGLSLLLLFTNEFLANELMRQWELPATPYSEMTKHYEWGIVLSGVAKAQMEPDDRVYFTRGADRVVHAVELYKKGIIKKILVSGGSGRLLDIGEREANDLASAFELMGVNPADILVESSSRNTYESAVAVQALLVSKSQPDSCLLITSGFHMRRSRASFEKAGWSVDTFSADFLSHPRTFTFDVLFIPRIDALTIWHHLIKETVGYLSYKVAGYI